MIHWEWLPLRQLTHHTCVVIIGWISSKWNPILPMFSTRSHTTATCDHRTRAINKTYVYLLLCTAYTYWLVCATHHSALIHTFIHTFTQTTSARTHAHTWNAILLRLVVWFQIYRWHDVWDINKETLREHHTNARAHRHALCSRIWIGWIVCMWNQNNRIYSPYLIFLSILWANKWASDDAQTAYTFIWRQRAASELRLHSRYTSPLFR